MARRHSTTQRYCTCAALICALLASAAGVAQPEAPAVAQPDAPAVPRPDAPGATPLSLETAIVRALEVGEEVLLARSDLRIAAERIRAARAEARPRLDSNASYQRTLETPFRAPGDLGELPFGNENTWIALLTLSQPLFTGGAVGAALDIARAFDEQAQSRAVEDYAELALGVTQAYYTAVLAERLAEITEAQMAQVERELARARTERAVGNASELDVLRAEVDLENLTPELVAAENARLEAELELKRLVDLPPDEPLELTDRLDTESFTPITEARLEELAAGWERRAALRAAVLQVAIERSQVALVDAQYRPRVGLNLRLAEQALPRDAVPNVGQFEKDWSVSVDWSMPLFTGGRRRAERAIAEEEVVQAELALEQLEETIRLDVVRSRSEVRRAVALIEARRRTVGQAEEVYRLTQLAFEQGVASFLELDDARFSLRAARANEAQALQDYYLALARFLRDTGAPLAVSTLRLIQTPEATRRSNVADDAAVEIGPQNGGEVRR